MIIIRLLTLVYWKLVYLYIGTSFMTEGSKLVSLFEIFIFALNKMNLKW